MLHKNVIKYNMTVIVFESLLQSLQSKSLLRKRELRMIKGFLMSKSTRIQVLMRCKVKMRNKKM